MPVQLPNIDKAKVGEIKLTRYLLNEDHPDNGGKARFFRALGYETERWRDLAQALHTHAEAHSVARTEHSVYGMKCPIEGPFPPSNPQRWVRAVWMIDNDSAIPRFIVSLHEDQVRPTQKGERVAPRYCVATPMPESPMP